MENKIENLTDSQENFMDEIAINYEKYALSGVDDYNVEIIQEGIDFLYEIVELKKPEITICPSPADMVEMAELKQGESFDFIGCGYDSGWTAFYDFMQQIGVPFDDDWGFNIWRKFITESGVFATIFCENVAFVCIRPCVVKRTPEGELHCEDNFAIAWRDGYGEYFLNGVAVDESIVKTSFDKLDGRLILTEKNAEIRREIVRKIGIERICQQLNAKTLDSSEDYELLGLDIGDKNMRPYLKMKNPSIGTYHIEGVHPLCKNVEDALSWRNGTKEKPITLT